MSVDTVTSESLKEKAKVISKFMKEKYNVDVLHGHSLDLISRLSGYNGWNVASAAMKSKAGHVELPLKIKTVADMKAALAHFKDSDILDAGYDFKLKHYLDELDDIDPSTNFP